MVSRGAPSVAHLDRRSVARVERRARRLQPLREVQAARFPARRTDRSRRTPRRWQMLRQVADSPASVLIFGESGTGKELAARALHDCSSRKDAPFVAVEMFATGARRSSP